MWPHLPLILSKNLALNGNRPAQARKSTLPGWQKHGFPFNYASKVSGPLGNTGLVVSDGSFCGNNRFNASLTCGH